VPSVIGKEQHTFTARQFRAKAAEYAELLKHTDIPSERLDFMNSRRSFESLAQNEQWLADNFDKTIHAPE
jgi:hypothetical protein